MEPKYEPYVIMCEIRVVDHGDRQCSLEKQDQKVSPPLVKISHSYLSVPDNPYLPGVYIVQSVSSLEHSKGRRGITRHTIDIGVHGGKGWD